MPIQTITSSTRAIQVIILADTDGTFSLHAEGRDGVAMPASRIRGKSWTTQAGAERAAKRYLSNLG